MAKKSVARSSGAVRRKSRAPVGKAPAALVKLPPAGAAPARSTRARKKSPGGRQAGPTVGGGKPAKKGSRAAAERAFVEGLVARGEVAEPGAVLRPGVTHEVVGRKSSGTPQVARRRFSLR